MSKGKEGADTSNQEKPGKDGYLRYNFELLETTCILPGKKDKFVFSAGLFTFLSIMLLGQIYDLYVHHESIEAITRRLSTFTQTGLGALKSLVLFLNRKRVFMLMRTINTNFGEPEQRQDPIMVRMMSDCDRQVRRLTNALAVIVIISLAGPWISVMLRPYDYVPVEGDPNNATVALRRVPFRISYPGADIQRIGWYVCVMTIHAGVALVYTTVAPATEAFMIGLIAHTAVQLEGLQRSLRALGIEAEDGGKKGDREALRKCLRHHKTILWFVEELDKLLHIIFLAQFASSVGCFGTCVLYIVSEPSEAPLLAGIMTAALLQLGVLCYYADLVKEQSLAVSDAAYGGEWYTCPQDVQRGLQLVALRGQKALVLSIGGVMEVSLSTYAQVIKISYSFFTMVRDMN